MALEKKEKLTAFQRVRRLILGKTKPNRVTRISVGIGFLIWVYLVSWQLLTLMALVLMGSLEQADLIKGSFNRVGSKLYGFSDTLGRLTIHNLVELSAFGLVLIALILIYRKKRIGFILYVAGNFIILAATPLVMGMKFFQYEMSYSYVIILGISTLYFLIGALWFYRRKAKKTNDDSTVNSYST